VFNTYADPGAQRRLGDEATRPRDPLARLVELGLADDVKEKGKEKGKEKEKIGAA
jgi:hypothetical protein